MTPLMPHIHHEILHIHVTDLLLAIVDPMVEMSSFLPATTKL